MKMIENSEFEMLEEIEKLRRKNKELTEELNRIKTIKEVSEKESPADCLKSIITYLKPRIRIMLGYYIPEMRKIEKSAPLKLDALSISENSIMVNYTLFKFSEEKRRIDGFDELFPISVFVGDKSDINVTDAVTKTVFDLFAGRSDFRVGQFSSKIRIPFKLNLHAESVIIAPREGNHAKYLIDVIQQFDCLTLKEPNSYLDLSFAWLRNAKRIELINSLHPDVRINCLNTYSGTMYVYFGNCTDCLEYLVLSWCEEYKHTKGSKLIISIVPLRAEEAVKEMLESRIFVQYGGFHRVSDNVLISPTTDSLETRMTTRWYNDEDRKRFSVEFRRQFDCCKLLCLEVLQSSQATTKKIVSRKGFRRIFSGFSKSN